MKCSGVVPALCLLSTVWAAPVDAGIPQIAPLPQGSPVVTAEPLSYPVQDSSLSAAGHKLTIPGEIVWTGLDRPGEVLFTRFRSKEYGKGSQEVLLAYDLRARSVRWARLVRDASTLILSKACIVASGDTTFALSLDTGEVLWRRAGTPLPTPLDHLVLVGRKPSKGEPVAGIPAELQISELYPGGSGRKTQEAREDGRVISAHDFLTGTVLWERFGRFGNGIEWGTCGDGWCYYTVPAGLEAVELRAGDGWFISASSTSTSAVAGLGFAVGLGLTFLGGVSMGTDFAAAMANDLNFGEWYPPEVTHHLGSPPLITGGQLYFAAHKEIFSCSAATGEIVWKRHLDDLQGVTSIRPLGDRILTVSPGWRYVGSRIEPCRFASLSVIEPSTGDTLRSLRWSSHEERSTLRNGRLEKDLVLRTVLDALPYPGGVLLLQPSAIRLHSNRLDPLMVLPSREEYGDLLTWMPGADGVIVRTSKGVLSLTGSPPRVVWWRAIPPLLLHDGKRFRSVDEFVQGKKSVVRMDNTWIAPALSRQEIARIATGRAQHAQDFLMGRVLCTRSGSGFTCLDAREGQVLLDQSDLKASEVALDPSGRWISRSLNQITVVRITDATR